MPRRRAADDRSVGRKQTLHLLESLEPRRFLDTSALVIPPTNVAVTIGYREAPDGATDRAHLTWTDNNSLETGYRVEYSLDGINNWSAIGPDVPANSTGAAQVLDAGQKYYYRVRAVQGTSTSAPSATATPITPVDRVVQVSAETVTGGVNVMWPLDSDAVSYTVSRKRRNESGWTLLTPAPLSGNATGFYDNIGRGNAYEYKVERVTHNFYGTIDGTAYGYVYAAKSAPLTEGRGRALLVVDQTQVAALSPKLQQLRLDLIGDGWSVDQINVPRDNGDAHLAASIKLQIQQRYFANPGGLQSIILIGHVPVPYSGTTNWDSHPDHVGAWPSDLYYGESLATLYSDSPWTDVLSVPNPNNPDNNNMPGDGKFDQSNLPFDATVPVGRIDFANCPDMGWTFSPRITNVDVVETELLKRYLDKDHAWRVGDVTAQSRALVDDQFGAAFAENGWRNFAPLVGAANTAAVDWESNLHTSSYLLAYGCAPGGTDNAQNVVGNGNFYSPTSQYQVVFSMLFGSYFGDWNKNANLMRQFIGTNGTALTCAWVGTPNWFVQGMGLGETIGQGTITSANNSGNGPYLPASVGMRGTQTALIGDPTLRMTIVHPVRQLAATRAVSGGTQLTWQAPNETGLSGYYVYRADTINGQFARISPLLSPGAAGQYTDNTAGGNTHPVYMVRAVKLSVTASGSYYNASTGQIAEVSGNIVAATSQDGTLAQPMAMTFRPSESLGLSSNAADKHESLSAVVDELTNL